MKLIQNWRNVALKSWSMWFIYAGLLLLILPEVRFAVWGVEANPYLSGYGGLALLVLGGLGRLLDQGGLDRSRLRSSAAVTVAAFLAIAVPFVGGWEGRSNHAYQDIVGVWTICDGHTKGVNPGDYMTDAQCDALFEAELIEYRDGLHAYFSERTLRHRLTPERDVAYVSLAYNAGIRGAGRSTATRRLNAGDIAGGCKALTWWNKAGGRVVRGLVRRRAAEYGLCMQGLA
ncbi:MAG: lysozyme [Pelagimonas sp.]|jgi:GH24 family phage-related lysozyme (muramidase)|nr:lysozyme [Pelagimonas sp.]